MARRLASIFVALLLVMIYVTPAYAATDVSVVAQQDKVSLVDGMYQVQVVGGCINGYHAVPQSGVWCRGNAFLKYTERHSDICEMWAYYACKQGYCQNCKILVIFPEHLCYVIHSLACPKTIEDYCGLG